MALQKSASAVRRWGPPDLLSGKTAHELTEVGRRAHAMLGRVLDEFDPVVRGRIKEAAVEGWAMGTAGGVIAARHIYGSHITAREDPALDIMPPGDVHLEIEEALEEGNMEDLQMAVDEVTTAPHQKQG